MEVAGESKHLKPLSREMTHCWRLEAYRRFEISLLRFSFSKKFWKKFSTDLLCFLVSLGGTASQASMEVTTK